MSFQKPAHPGTPGDKIAWRRDHGMGWNNRIIIRHTGREYKEWEGNGEEKTFGSGYTRQEHVPRQQTKAQCRCCLPGSRRSLHKAGLPQRGDAFTLELYDTKIAYAARRTTDYLPAYPARLKGIAGMTRDITDGVLVYSKRRTKGREKSPAGTGIGAKWQARAGAADRSPPSTRCHGR